MSQVIPADDARSAVSRKWIIWRLHDTANASWRHWRRARDGCPSTMRISGLAT